MANEGSVYSQHPFRRLALAVILQAKKDIDSAPDYIANDARAFVNRAWFDNLCALGDVNRDLKKQMLTKKISDARAPAFLSEEQRIKMITQMFDNGSTANEVALFFRMTPKNIYAFCKNKGIKLSGKTEKSKKSDRLKKQLCALGNGEFTYKEIASLLNMSCQLVSYYSCKFNLNIKKEVEPTWYKLAGKEVEIKERLKNETITSLAVKFGVSRTTLFYFIKKNNLKGKV